jgi:N6-adenosine-specific RNA methylase IME4
MTALRTTWASRIAAEWRRSLSAILEVGRLLTEAKDALPHGEFGAMIESELPFGARTAQMLMTIAADERLSNPKHASHLPPSWATLHELTKLPDDQFAAALRDNVIRPDMERREIAQTIKLNRRAEREQELGQKQAALPKQKFGVILADVEARYEPWSRLTGMDRAADNHYPTSELLTIQQRDVASICADDCVCFFWAFVPWLAEAFCVLDAWGFGRFERNPETGFLTINKRQGRYVSSAVWTKYWPDAGIGMGYWFRVDHEILLVATRGNVPAPAMGTQWRSIFDVPASEVHSQKPELVHEMIEEHFPNLLKIELNRRGPPRPGWSAWGLEAEEIAA